MLTFIPDPSPDPAPFEVIEGGPDARILLVCDHASKLVPQGLGDLGLERSERECHVAWDIGAALVTRLLAARLGCPAVLAGISRLVIDCNRQPGDPSSIPANSCTVEIPGNRNLSEAESDDRARRWFWPYHTEIGERIAHLWRGGHPPAVAAIHSFTPRIACRPPRPWHVGVLWNRDPRMSQPALEALRARAGLVVGENEPYSGRELNYTLDTHAGAAGLPNLSFEIRQDLVGDEAGCALWADILAETLAPILRLPDIAEARVY